MAKKSTVKTYYESVGRRKSAVARVRLYFALSKVSAKDPAAKLKKGEFVVNGRPVTDYFPGKVMENLYTTPLQVSEVVDRFAISVKVSGGGPRGQADAVVLGIARAIEKADAEKRKPLKEHGLLTRDPRARERRKVGTGGKARRQKQSPKR